MFPFDCERCVIVSNVSFGRARATQQQQQQKTCSCKNFSCRFSASVRGSTFFTIVTASPLGGGGASDDDAAASIFAFALLRNRVLCRRAKKKKQPKYQSSPDTHPTVFSMSFLGAWLPLLLPGVADLVLSFSAPLPVSYDLLNKKKLFCFWIRHKIYELLSAAR